MNIILAGLQTSGKTTVGAILSNRLKRPLIDTDCLIENGYANENKQSLTCRQISIKHGESFFRELERRHILSLTKTDKAVIALGGGSLMIPENIAALQSIGRLIYLKTPLTILWNRILQKAAIPSYLDPDDAKASFFAVAEKRIPIFDQTAHITIKTSHLTPEEIASAIISAI